jgi:hypothetical protein
MGRPSGDQPSGSRGGGLAAGVEDGAEGRIGEDALRPGAEGDVILGRVGEAADAAGGSASVADSRMSGPGPGSKKRGHLAAEGMDRVDRLQIAAPESVAAWDGAARDASMSSGGGRAAPLRPPPADAPTARCRRRRCRSRPASCRHIGLGAGRFDMVAKASSSAAASSTASAAVRVDRGAGEGRVADATRSRRGGRLIAAAWLRAAAAPSRARRVRPAQASSMTRGVADRPGEEPVDRHAGPALAGIGPVGQARARGLEPEQPAGRGRDAHRSAAVRPMRHGHDPRRHRRPGPARRSARGMVRFHGLRVGPP